MKFDNYTKNQVLKDWSDEYPVLNKFGTNKLYQVLGPMIIGIELLSLPSKKSYRPVIVAYPLWKEDLDTCFKIPYILDQFDNVDYDNHGLSFPKYVNQFNKRSIISFGKSINLRNFHKMIDKYIQNKSYLTVTGGPLSHGRLLEIKLISSLYSGNHKLGNKIINEIKKTAPTWDSSQYDQLYGNIDNWISIQQKRIDEKDRILKTIKTNKSNPKLSKLNSYKVENRSIFSLSSL